MDMKLFFTEYYNFYNSREWRKTPGKFYADDIVLDLDPLRNIAIRGNKNLVDLYDSTLIYVEDKVEIERMRIFGDGKSFAVEVPETYHWVKQPDSQQIKDQLAVIGLVEGAQSCRVLYFMHYELNDKKQFGRIAAAILSVETF